MTVVVIRRYGGTQARVQKSEGIVEAIPEKEMLGSICEGEIKGISTVTARHITDSNPSLQGIGLGNLPCGLGLCVQSPPNEPRIEEGGFIT